MQGPGDALLFGTHLTHQLVKACCAETEPCLDEPRRAEKAAAGGGLVVAESSLDVAEVVAESSGGLVVAKAVGGVVLVKAAEGLVVEVDLL